MTNLPSPPSQDAFTSEALPHLEAVAAFARRLTGSEPDGDDLTQETYLRAYRSWSTYEPGTSCRAWLFTICRNAHRNARIREQRIEAVSDPDLEALAAAALHAGAVEAGLNDVFDRFDLGDALRREIDALPLPTREVVVLVDLEEWSYAATADALGIPVGTVRSRLFRGRRVLQEGLLAHARDAGIVKHREREGRG